MHLNVTWLLAYLAARWRGPGPVGIWEIFRGSADCLRVFSCSSAASGVGDEMKLRSFCWGVESSDVFLVWRPPLPILDRLPCLTTDFTSPSLDCRLPRPDGESLGRLDKEFGAGEAESVASSCSLRRRAMDLNTAEKHTMFPVAETSECNMYYNRLIATYMSIFGRVY